MSAGCIDRFLATSPGMMESAINSIINEPTLRRL